MILNVKLILIINSNVIGLFNIELLEENICENYKNCLTRACRHCKIDVGLKIIKLPEIFIFTLIRDKEIRNMQFKA